MNLGQMRRPWKVSEGSDRYRRGLYTFFWRATPHPGLIAFDAPNAIQSCTRRNRSNTPIQALTLLNETSFVECATALGVRINRESVQEERQRINLLFQTCLGRLPTDQEAKMLSAVMSEERQEAPKGNPWITAACVLLNLDEFITRE